MSIIIILWWYTCITWFCYIGTDSVIRFIIIIIFICIIVIFVLFTIAVIIKFCFCLVKICTRFSISACVLFRSWIYLIFGYWNLFLLQHFVKWLNLWQYMHLFYIMFRSFYNFEFVVLCFSCSVLQNDWINRICIFSSMLDTFLLFLISCLSCFCKDLQSDWTYDETSICSCMLDTDLSNAIWDSFYNYELTWSWSSLFLSNFFFFPSLFTDAIEFDPLCEVDAASSCTFARLLLHFYSIPWFFMLVLCLCTISLANDCPLVQ